MNEIMKMVLVVYNEAVDMEVLEAVGKCGIKNYTKVMNVYGKGTTSGTHLGDDIWPGRNNLLYVACPYKEASQLILAVKELRKKLGKEGVKAFLMPLEDLT